MLFEKTVPCAFINSPLEEALTKLNQKEIVLVGVSTNNSIEATARTAGNLGYQVYVVEDACFTFDKTDYYGKFHPAAEVHAMSLANLDGEYASVLSCEELLSKFR